MALENEEVLEESAADYEAETQEAIGRWITFQLGEETYGVDVIQVREILRVFNILPVPGAPNYVLGITNIRGSVVTVTDGRSRFSLPSQEQSEATRLIVLERGDDVVGVIVDSVSDVVDLPESTIDTSPKMNNREGSKFIKGVVTLGEELIIILHIEKFFMEE